MACGTRKARASRPTCRYHSGVQPLRVVAALLQRLVDKVDPHEGRFRMLFERSPLPMWVVDTETLRFLAVNDAALRLYEYPREEFLALSAADMRRAEDAAPRMLLAGPLPMVSTGYRRAWSSAMRVPSFCAKIGRAHV